MNLNLKGTGVALVTPFQKHSTVDFNALNRLVEHVISGGVDYLVVLGTTGESVTLSKDEKNAVIHYVIETNDGRVPIVLGVGGNNTQE
ncbi:MAG: 4-hydroxy-tetrahydrodipicolinate synthase, partial [Clostridia bacterium]|nr:4-hydroxy-tetrahydrodipicolinate synthase [Clostridia bacterium]